MTGSTDRARPVAPATAFAVAAFGILVFSGMDAVMKGLVLAIGVYPTMLWRSLAGVVLSGAIYGAGRPTLPGRTAMRLHIVRGLVGKVMAVTFFWGLARVPMAQAIALAFIAPIVALVLSALILKERVPPRSIVACLLAVVGVGLILAGQARSEPGPDAVEGTIAVLFSAVCYAFNIVLMRAQALVAKPVEVAFWQTIVVSGGLLLAAPWLAVVPAAEHWPAILLAAVLATASLMLLGWAYAHAPASHLAPSEYTAFLWAAALGWLMFGETLSPWTLAGAAVIVVGCIVAARAVPVVQAAP
ncbi:DMT family transporter [Sphingomonas sp. RS2018]